MDLVLVSGSRRQGATSNFRETGFSKGGNRRFESEGHIPRRGLIGTRFDYGRKMSVEVPPK
jgi:hypothetical protein